MRVLIANFFLSGHNLQFAAMLCRGVIRAGAQPVLLTPVGSTNSTFFPVHFDVDVRCGVEIHESLPDPHLRSTIERLKNAWYSIQTLHQGIKDHRCDHVLLHNADMCTIGNLARPWLNLEVPTSALLLRGGYAYKRAGLQTRCSDALTKHAALHAPWSTLWHLDPLSAEYLTRFGRAVEVMPEPVEAICTSTIQGARQQLGLPNDRRLLVMQGALDSRKGTIELLRAALIARLPDTTIVLLGEIDRRVRDEVYPLIKSLGPSKCIVIDRPLSQEDFLLGFVASDWQLIPYQRHIGSSGVMVRAAAHNRPVISSNWGWVGEATRRYDLGICCDTTSIQQLANAMEHALQYKPPARSPLCNKFITFNTKENFIAHWFKSIRESLGMPADIGYATWPVP